MTIYRMKDINAFVHVAEARASPTPRANRPLAIGGGKSVTRSKIGSAFGCCSERREAFR